MGRAPHWQSAEERPVLVLGSGGMLATALADILEEQEQHYVALSEVDLDITHEGRVAAVFKSLNPRVVINAAAYTDVDGAESSPDIAFAVNGAGAGNVASAGKAVDALVVHISTDYVFDGRKKGSYRPQDRTGPIGVYGKSKLEGELQVRKRSDRHLIIRTAWLFGPGGKNFVTTMLRFGRERDSLKVVDDQIGSPTFTRHLAKGIVGLANRDVTGVHHLTNSGTCTWYGLAEEIFRQSGIEVAVNACTTEEYPTPARRPANSVLDCSAAYAILGGQLPGWREGLTRYLEELGELSERKTGE